MDKNATQDIVKNGKITHAGFAVTLDSYGWMGKMAQLVRALATQAR